MKKRKEQKEIRGKGNCLTWSLVKKEGIFVFAKLRSLLSTIFDLI